MHSFCSDVLRRHPREAGVDPAFGVDEGPTFQALFAEEWTAFLADELGPQARRPATWRRALGVAGALEVVRALGGALASFRLARRTPRLLLKLCWSIRPASPRRTYRALPIAGDAGRSIRLSRMRNT